MSLKHNLVGLATPYPCPGKAPFLLTRQGPVRNARALPAQPLLWWLPTSKSDRSGSSRSRHGGTSLGPASERLERYAAAGRPLAAAGQGEKLVLLLHAPRGRFEGEKGLVW